ncbi:carotenoid 1,2-hydratase [Hydrogenophaga crocea]|uniref:Carotenoid 1,2-hydratase n=1 Tax=Hydrogenophaga crocea TaxID=2716225 RepID=A0A6G8IBX7_9BURK|nr:carotenoid 1,2-hydratase [Hydrogenophaga crocea]QIM50643.1 carotenoid 1,2-hydratase [Hydrogenophaga crocea]
MGSDPLAFDAPVPDGGYAWWYLDALSEDGRHGLTAIVFIGSVFSPYYAWAQQRGRGRALDHCAVNLALYAGPDAGAPRGWTMTERGAGAVRQGRDALVIGPSEIAWDGEWLCLRVRERTAPWGRRIEGEIRVRPQALHATDYPLDAAGRHRWTPIAPVARVQVALDAPALRWQGRAYLDSNRGDRPIAQDLQRWDWSRAAIGREGCAVFYDATRRDGSHAQWALRFGGTGAVHRVAEPPPMSGLPRSAWGLRRRARADAGAPLRLHQPLEDGPFYARSVLRTRLLGWPADAIHETVDLDRWQRPLVQAMLPFRMPRRA